MSSYLVTVDIIGIEYVYIYLLFTSLYPVKPTICQQEKWFEIPVRLIFI